MHWNGAAKVLALCYTSQGETFDVVASVEDLRCNILRIGSQFACISDLGAGLQKSKYSMGQISKLLGMLHVYALDFE